ncbi:xanthine dehydrogenase small subunit [Crenobacter sp. SG2305]|uniref:xanthine dehydrogenase small subunit n=1 Tax=Crenobacter oryzisoli TaxID=3056844 RepID=UPI0025AA69C5|nr:xanthine dehydrogenase small subunit [Crenobacter sp. SG2305]MDN0083543.1 xanthine dehydrogenase small subunit [Crenobacter sp. SG2305]
MTHRTSVRFFLNGQLHEVVPSSPTQTLLNYLREDVGLTGTKEGCAEGDCGACTVTEATLEADGKVHFRAINACIRFVPSLDGKALWTVEGVAQQDGSLHPVQQAMVDCHGSQCGFCTPGFVMSMYTMYQNGDVKPCRDEVLDNLSGNLCRCTGYRPIIDAVQSMGSYPAVPTDVDAVTEQLKSIRPDSTVALEGNGQRYFAPATAAELASLYEQYPDAIILAGGTDVGLWVTKNLMTLKTVIYLGNVEELKVIEQNDSEIRINAASLLNDAFPALVNEYPELEELWKRFSSMPIRNSGTLVGNVANGSPIGDSAPILIAIGTRVVLRKGERRRELALEDLYLDYRKQDREAGEFVEAIVVPKRRTDQAVATYKLSKRFDQDISAVCGAYALRLDNGKVADARIAYGGMAATSKRAISTEKALIGKQWSEETVRAAMEAMGEDYRPMTDMRASSDYRIKTAKNLLLRFYLESTGAADTRV